MTKPAISHSHRDTASSAGGVCALLGDIVQMISGGTPAKDNSTYWNGSIPWVSAKDMKSFFIDDSQDHVSDLAIGSGARMVPGGTVLLLTRGMTLLKDVPICVARRSLTFNQDVKALQAKSTLVNEYLPYLLLGNKTRLLSLVDLAGHGTGRLNSDSLRALEVWLPSIPEQRAIASILGALDDKIDLNRRMCQTLEEMARALFKSWFVDFDPVRAKMEGRDPSLPKEIADLFPSRLVDSELGPIPEGWRVGRTSDIADVIYGAPFASSRFNDQKHGVPLVRIRDLGSQAPAVWTDEVHPKGYRLSSGDVVVGMDGEFRAHLWAGPDAWLNQRVCVFKPRDGYCRVFVRNAITAPLEFIERTETATTVIHLGKSDIDQFKFVVAPTSVHQRFSDLALPWYGRMVAARHETTTLTALRDTLLPKLISGEVRVPASLGSMQEVAS